MEDLISQNAHRLETKKRYKSVPVMALLTFVFSGLFFGISMWVATRDVFTSPDWFVAAGLKYGTVMGLLVLFVMPILFYFQNAFANSLYKIPLPHEGVQYRMLCSWVKPNKQGVGGFLYLGKGFLEFAPFSRNNFIDVTRKLTDNLEIKIVKLPLNIFQGLMWGFNISLIEIKTDVDVISIWVPQSNPTIEQIKDNLESAIQKVRG